MILPTINNNVTIPIVALLFLKLLLLFYLYNNGFISLSADECSRGITAAQWADRDLSTSFLMTNWLPGEIFLNGFSLMVWDNVIWTPRITAFVFSCFLLIYFIKLVQYLFDQQMVTSLAGLFLVFNSWYTWLSGTPMLDIYYLALYIAGLYYFLVWSNTRRNLYLLLSIGFFCLSTTFHFQSWILVNVVNLCACLYAWEMLRKRDYKNLSKLILFFIANNLFIATYLIAEYYSTGEWFYLMHGHANFTKEYYHGYNVGAYEKLVYYFRLIAMNGNIIGLFIPIGLYYLGTKSHKTLTLFPCVVGLGSLLLYSVFNLFSVPAAAVPGRYSFPFILLFMPYAALGLNTFFMESGYFTNIRFRRAFFVTLIIFIVGVNFVQTRRFPADLQQYRKALDAGLYLNQLINSDVSEKTNTVVIELESVDSYCVLLGARDFDRLYFDRKDDEMNGPSDLFIMEEDEILDHMRREKTKYLAIKNQATKNRLNEMPYMRKMKNFGEWDIYCVELAKHNSTCFER